MLVPVPQQPPSPLHVLGNMFSKRRHGEGEGTSGSSGSNEASDGSMSITTSSTDLASPTTPLQPGMTSESSFPETTATSNSSDTVSTFQFTDVQNATTCESYTVSWSYVGPSRTDFSLFVTENLWGPNNNATIPLHSGGSPPPLRMLSVDISPNATNFTWGSVDLQEGWYMLDARFAVSSHSGGKYFPQSAPLYVANGTDTSCVRSPTPTPNSHSHLGTGDIVGIVIGAVAAAGLLAVAFFFPRFWRRDLPSPKKPRPYYLY